MKYLIPIIISTLVTGCLSKAPSESANIPTQLNDQLINELETMADADQAVQNRYIEINAGTLSFPEFEQAQDSVFRKNQIRLKEILEEYGYPGYDLVGHEGENNFWLMVQHCDFDINFQKSVLARMEVMVQNGQADASNFGYLTDRVAVNSDQKQVYGSQLDYDVSIGRAIPLPITDSINVNVRRKSIGLPPLHEYLNDRIDDFWEMNREMIEANNLIEKPYYNP